MKMQSPDHLNIAEKIHSSDEDICAERLDEILEDPNNIFLHDVEKNRISIESADTAKDALEIALSLITRRLESTLKVEPLSKIEGFEVVDVNPVEIYELMKKVVNSNEYVGEGGDAVVVMAKHDLANLPPEVCYKIEKAAAVNRGRNLLSDEARFQEEAHEVFEKLERSPICVPRPLYVAEMGMIRFFAMEKLKAHSIDDIIHGRGIVPDWLDIDSFCNELKTAIDTLHKAGIYHRDLHLGNVMIRQDREKPKDDKLGYIIDFGLSAHGQENMEPYKTEGVGKTFTYRDDYVIVAEAKSRLEARRKAQQ